MIRDALIVTNTAERGAFVAEVARFDDIRLAHANLDDETLTKVHLAIARLDPPSRESLQAE